MSKDEFDRFDENMEHYWYREALKYEEKIASAIDVIVSWSYLDLQEYKQWLITEVLRHLCEGDEDFQACIKAWEGVSGKKWDYGVSP